MDKKHGAINQLRWDINRTLASVEYRSAVAVILIQYHTFEDFMDLIREEMYEQ